MSTSIRIFVHVLFTVILAFANIIAHADTSSSTAPDSSERGPYQIISAEYRFPASIDADVLNDRMTEIWGKIFLPQNQSMKQLPLVIMLHGNHATCGTGSHPRMDSSCQYTYSGECPKDYVPVPNHEGYNYIAENLASWGFIVASINANRGITCGSGDEDDWGLNLARGRLVLKHLSLLYKWSAAGQIPEKLVSLNLLNKIDFKSVGLFGHSRGGEGVRAAYNLYKDDNSPWPAKIPGLKIKAIFEIGAVDGQTSRVLDADGAVWNQLLPMCDGDVSSLEGRYPFERMLLNKSENSDAQKSLYEVWGANHNFFNTEWQSSDSYGCENDSPVIFDSNGWYSLEQQKIALASVPAFFRSRLGAHANAAFNQNFNPLKSLPSVVTTITQVDRDFIPSPGETDNLIVDDFDKKTGVNSSGQMNLSNQIEIKHQYLQQKPQRAATISWNAQGKDVYFEAVWAARGLGRDIRDYATLDFRIGRTGAAAKKAVNFSIALEDSRGLFSKEIEVSDYASINGPGNDNPILMTVRIPLSKFQGVDLGNIHGVRFIFDKTTSDSIYLANIRVQRQVGFGMDANSSLIRNIHRVDHTQTPRRLEIIPLHLNSIRNIRMMTLRKGKSSVEITLASQVPFPVLNSLPILKIGNHEFKLSRYSDPVQLKELTFTLTNEQYQNINKESEITVLDGKKWIFNRLSSKIK